MTETDDRPPDQDGRPAVLFLCVHNAGRSQMALGFFRHLAGDRAVAWSGGSEPGTQVNPSAVAAMREVGIDLSQAQPQKLTQELAEGASLLVTMGCGEKCPYVPGLRRDDWPLSDPKGRPLDEVRKTRDEVRSRVQALLQTEGAQRLES